MTEAVDPREIERCTMSCNVGRGHCGTCNRTFSRCYDHGDTRFNRCVCSKTTRHPDYPEEWA